MIPKEVLGNYLKPGMVMIETGTGAGEDVLTALELGASKIYTVEVRKDLYLSAVNMLQEAIHKYEEGRRIGVFHGHSPDVLKRTILPEVEEKAVIWLDAHTNYSSAALEEVKVIAEFPVRDHTILINNLRVFRKGTWMITMDGITDALKDINEKYTFRTVDSKDHAADILVARFP